MAVHHSNENLAQSMETLERELTLCTICQQDIEAGQECSKTPCDHNYHTECISSWLSASQECPYCRSKCHSRELRRINITHVSKTTTTSINPSMNAQEQRGAVPRYNTRNSKRQLYRDQNSQRQPNNDLNNSVTLLDLNDNRPNNAMGVPSSQRNRSRRNSNVRRNVNATQVDSSQVSQIVDAAIERLRSSLNIAPSLSNIDEQDFNQYMPSVPNIPVGNPSILRPDKITSIIQNWHVKFDGSTEGLTCNEFIYRVRSLTAESLNNDFYAVCKNLHVLLLGKAKTWFWRYHKQVPVIDWNSFCTALRFEFKDHRSTYDLREEIRNRKQLPNETFTSFYDTVMAMLDRLPVPMEETELVELLTRNLRPDIRHELLYVPIQSVAHLRKLVHMRENLLKEAAFKSHTASRPSSFNHGHRRDVATVESVQPEEERLDEEIREIAAVDRERETARKLVCWNCDEEGHPWDMCVSGRKIFCYGCGAKNVYKPQCESCKAKPKNSTRGAFDQKRMPQNPKN